MVAECGSQQSKGTYFSVGLLVVSNSTFLSQVRIYFGVGVGEGMAQW